WGRTSWVGGSWRRNNSGMGFALDVEKGTARSSGARGGGREAGVSSGYAHPGAPNPAGVEPECAEPGRLSSWPLLLPSTDRTGAFARDWMAPGREEADYVAMGSRISGGCLCSIDGETRGGVEG